MILFKIFLSALLCLAGLVNAEEYKYGSVTKIDIVNYHSGAAYVFVEGKDFTECKHHVNWCAIDFSLPSSNQMFSAVLAAKMANKPIGVTTNACWGDGGYPRCWKVHVKD